MDSVLRTLSKIAIHTNTQGVVNYPLNEKNRDTLCTTLIEFNLKICAIWIVSRPIQGHKKNTFQHWTVKIVAYPILLSMGFVECKKKGAFRLDQTMCADHNLKDFFYYFVNAKRQRFHIVTCVIPPLINNDNKLKDTHSVDTLKKYMKLSINIKKRVCDIADFIEMWSTDMCYNAITSNCQHFAADLFAFLVQTKYPKQVNLAVGLMDDGCDKRKYKRLEVLVVDDEKTEMPQSDNLNVKKMDCV